MKANNNRIKFTEISLIILVWLVLLLTPILFRDDYINPLRKSIAVQLEIMLPVMFIFMINRFILVPKLLFKGKQGLFIAVVFSLIATFTLGSYIYDTNIKQKPPVQQPFNLNLRAPQPGIFPQGINKRQILPLPQNRQPRPVPPFGNVLIFSLLIVGFDTGLQSGLRWFSAENEKVQLEKENVATQLVLLRNQISPHFFMNTLNNIHSLVDINTDEAKEAIIKLSNMMRYLLYETETEKTTLKKEIEFLESYINLMKLRFSDKVKISFSRPTVVPEKTLPPFLFISLIENAFKHGISYREESFIAIDLAIGDQRLLLTIKNSKTNKATPGEGSGIGLENTRKRLALLYGDNYHFDVIDSDEVFTTSLSIPL